MNKKKQLFKIFKKTNSLKYLNFITTIIAVLSLIIGIRECRRRSRFDHFQEKLNLTNIEVRLNLKEAKDSYNLALNINNHSQYDIKISNIFLVNFHFIPKTYPLIKYFIFN